MMNSTNNKGTRKEGIDTIVSEVKSHFKGIDVTYVQYHEVAIDLFEGDTHQALIYLKAAGFKQLSALTCVDWIEEGRFQLIFNLFDWKKGIRLILRAKIQRENPKFATITMIYPGAKYYEIEVHEMFGIIFEGNPEGLKQLFLEQWKDLPPLRKDFDARAYSDKKYIKREYKTSFGEPGGEPFERN